MKKPLPCWKASKSKSVRMFSGSNAVSRVEGHSSDPDTDILAT